MNLELDGIQIFVSDYKKAKDWYRDILGMELIKEYPDIQCVWMKLGNIDFYVETPNPGWGEGWDKVKIGGRTPIVFNTGDIEKTVKELKEKGVKFVEEIQKRNWGKYKAVFSDLDGNDFNLVQKDEKGN